jgi:hypothetical protein
MDAVCVIGIVAFIVAVLLVVPMASRRAAVWGVAFLTPFTYPGEFPETGSQLKPRKGLKRRKP